MNLKLINQFGIANFIDYWPFSWDNLLQMRSQYIQFTLIAVWGGNYSCMPYSIGVWFNHF